MMRTYDEKLPEVLGKRESTENRLERRKKQLEEELEAINAAIELFKNHPEISSALDLLGRVNLQYFEVSGG